MRLRLEEITFDKGSVVDPAGKVFHYDGRIFRAITPEYAPLYREILQAPFAKELFDAGLVETWISDLSVEGYELVLEHRKVPILSYWMEWCSEMIKDAALMVLRLNLTLLRHGFCTKDIQPGNVQFLDGRPYWIDFGSIVRARSLPRPRFRFDEFRYHWLVPLWLMAKGWYALGQLLFAEGSEGFWKRHINRRPFRWFPLWYPLLKRPAWNDGIHKSLEKLLTRVQTLRVMPREGEWTNYGQGGMPPVDRPDLFKPKALAVYRMLQQLPRGTVLDCGGNKGWHAELAVHLGNRATSFDLDDAAVCCLYRRVKERRLPILPLVVDFLRPTPAFGVALGRPSALERLRSDTVLALALVHHLVFSHDVSFEAIGNILSGYAIRHAIVEFAPADDRQVQAKWGRRVDRYVDWYSLDNFQNTLQRYFRTVEVSDSFPPPRKLLLCRKE